MAVAWLFTVMVIAVPSSVTEANELVRLQLKWEHQFQFAGYYAAIEQGYYEEAGIQVELIPAAPGIDPITEVLEGRAEFGVGTSDLLLHFHQGDPVVVLAVIFQHSPLILLSKTNNPLQTLHDLDGKPVAIESGTAELYAYLKREGVRLGQFNVVQHAYHLGPLLTDQVAAQSAYSTTEIFELDKRGIGYQIYSPRSAGIDFYGDNLFTTHDILNNNPDLVEAFREASLRGWLYAMSHPEKMIDLILTHYPTIRSREALRHEAERMHDLMRTDLIEPGHMISGRWQHMAEVYAEIGMLPENISLEGFLYQPEFIEVDLRQIYIGLVIASLLAVIFALVASMMMYYNRRLRRSELRLRTLFDTAPLAFMVIDHHGDIKEWNASASRIFNWPRDEIIDRNVFETIISADNYTVVKEILDRTINESHPVTFMNTNITRDGSEITCEWVNAPYIYNDKEDEAWILSIAADITERVAIEKALKKASDDAQEALNEHKQLISMLSHELRSPLATIASANAVLKASIRQGDYEDVSLMNNRINSAIHRLRQFLDNLTADDRLSTLSFSNHRVMVDFQTVLQKSINAVRDVYPDRKINIIHSGPDQVMGPEPVLLDVVMTNLLDNALKYSAAHTDISISLVSRADNTICLEVHNYGTSIPLSQQTAIFRKYFRGDVEKTSGTGMGLYLVKRIVDTHNGTVSLFSSENEGTLFRVIFPS